MGKLVGRKADTRIHLTGDFRVELISGEDVTPSSAKARALLALLVTAPNGSRSRSWIQSKLWSDRAPEQASGSLRQCLVQLRKALSARPGLMEATRQKVAVDLSRVDLVFEQGEDILEGLEVNDEGFEEWLRFVRNREFGRAAPISSAVPKEQKAAGAPKFVFIKVNAPDDEFGWLGRILSDNLARLLRETFSVDVIVSENDVRPESAWQVDIETYNFSRSQVIVRMSLTDPKCGSQSWAKSVNVEMRGAPPCEHPLLNQLTNQLIEAFSDELFLGGGPDPSCPDTLCRHAIRNLFTVRTDAVEIADEMFAQAFEIQPRGLYLAWRAQVNTIKKIERHFSDDVALAEETEALCARALELEPNNSMVLATIANTYSLFFRAHQRGLLLAERSASLNPTNPMSWWALSTASMYAGKEQSALRHAYKGHQLAVTSPYRFWWDTQIFGAALVNARLGEAQKFAEICHAQNPEFRPPLRYLMALYANLGHDEEALKLAGKLAALEPDFTIDRLVRDHDYPASVLHKEIGVDLNKLAALA